MQSIMKIVYVREIIYIKKINYKMHQLAKKKILDPGIIIKP